MPYMDAIGFDNSDIRGNQMIYFVTMHFIASANLHVMLKLWACTQLEFSAAACHVHTYDSRECGIL